MASYHFTDTWQFMAPPEKVWDIIYDVSAWPHWWRGFLKVRPLVEKNPGGIGDIYEFHLRSVLPYTLVYAIETTRVEHLKCIEGRSSGSLDGTGLWEFFPEGPLTTTTITWKVRTTPAWMNLLSPLARPLFAWNHEVIMQRGKQGLIQLLKEKQGEPES